MILASLCRDTVFGRFLDTVDSVKSLKNIGFSMVFDDFRDVDRCLIGTAKVSKMARKVDPKWSNIGPKMVSITVSTSVLCFDCFLELFWVPKWSQNGSQMVPKVVPKWSPKRFKSDVGAKRRPYDLPIDILALK